MVVRVFVLRYSSSHVQKTIIRLPIARRYDHLRKNELFGRFRKIIMRALHFTFPYRTSSHLRKRQKIVEIIENARLPH